MSYSVVIIDDEELIAEGIIKSFDWEKYSMKVVETFLDATSFINYIDKHKVDVVFTDIKLPLMNGLELIDKVKFEMELSDVQFVIISAYDDYDYMRKAINLGVIDYIRKPIIREETDSVLEKVYRALSDIDGTLENQCRTNKDFQDLIYYINTHYDDKLTLKELSKKFYFNRNYLCLLFKKHLNTSFSDYILQIRMKKAKELLETTTLSISAIAEKTGYKDYSYFNKSFTDYHKITPGSYRKHATTPEEK